MIGEPSMRSLKTIVLWTGKEWANLMVRNRMSKGLNLITFDRVPQKKTISTDSEVAPSSSVLNRFMPSRRDEASQVMFWPEEGVVEIRDARLFRDEQQQFCLIMVEEMVRPGLAQRVEIRLASSTCRIEFEPGRHDRNSLATQVAAALKIATVRASRQLRATMSDGTRSRWVSLTASTSNGRILIWETLVDLDGSITSRPRQPIVSSKTSPYTNRLWKSPGRPARSSPSRARLFSDAEPSPNAEPIALAFSVGPIFRKNSEALAIPSRADSQRMVNLALAGGSFALAVAGVVLPGIPALPFLLLTGHYLIRSSPELCRTLGNVPGIGALLKKAGEAGSQVIDRRSFWKMFGFAVATVAAFLVFHPPLPVVILLEAGIIVYYGLREFRKSRRPALNSPALTGLLRVA